MKKIRNKILVGCVMLFSASVFASADIQTLFIQKYPDLAGTNLDSCSTCHSPVVDKSLNYYGLSLMDQKLNFDAAALLDQDADGIITQDEIDQLTSPGSRVMQPGVFVFHSNNKPVTFNHSAHNVDPAYGINGSCEQCHGTGGLAKIFDDNVLIKNFAHATCKGCHSSSGRANAPTGCNGCHK